MSRHTTLALGAFAAVAALAAGCQAHAASGSQSQGGEEPRTATQVASHSESKPSSGQSLPGLGLVPRCHTSGLHGSLHYLDAGAGQRYETLTLTNVSGHTCRVYGWPGLTLSAIEEGVPTHAVHEGTPQTITLAAGSSASARLHWTVVPTAPEPTDGPCQVSPVQLWVTPPGESTHLVLNWANGAVCNQGTIYVTPLRPGTGPVTS